jgi:hypothetical protein
VTFVSLSAPEVEPDREVDPGALQLQRDLCEFLRLKIKLFLLITGGPLDGAGTSPWQAVPLRPAFPVLRIDEWRPGKRDIDTAKRRWLLSCATCCSARLSILSKLAIVFFDALQNAQLVVDAETLYRFMYYGSVDLWDLRDQHMFDILEPVFDFHGP